MTDEILIGMHDQYKILMVAEKSERKLFQGLAGLVKKLAQRGTPGIEGAP